MDVSQKKVLVISHGTPHPYKGASAVLFYLYLKALKDTGAQILHCCINNTDSMSDWDEYISAIKPNTSFHVVHSLVPHYFTISKYRLEIQVTCPDLLTINSIVRYEPDIVLCFDVLSAAVAKQMGFNNLKVWLGDLQFRSHWYNALYDIKGKDVNLMRLPFMMLYCVLWKRLYKDVLSTVNLAIVSSVSSELPVREMGANSSIYLPYPWPDGGTIVHNLKKYVIPTFIMFGTLSVLGSKSAFDFLFTKVIPLLRKQWRDQQFKIIIAGSRSMPKWAEKYLVKYPEVKFVGFVDDLGALVSRCHAVLAPISVPVGNRSRIITAMSMSSLIIAHKNTALGNPELISGYNCYLADSDISFASFMRQSFEQQTVSIQLGQAARQTYLNSFEPAVATKQFLKAIYAIP